MKTARSDHLPIHFDPFGNPDPWQATPGMFDDLHLPAQFRLDPLAEAFLLVSTIGPDQLEPRKEALERCQQELATASVLTTGFMHQHVQHQPIRIDQQMALAAFDLFAPIVAAGPPFCVVFTDWLSMMAALGVGSRPAWTRTCSRKAVCIRCQVPSLRLLRK